MAQKKQRDPYNSVEREKSKNWRSKYKWFYKPIDEIAVDPEWHEFIRECNEEHGRAWYVEAFNSGRNFGSYKKIY